MASLLFSTLEQLIVKFLKSADSYNASDSTVSTPDADQDTAWERAKICLNQALGLIYSLIKDSRYLEAYPTTALLLKANEDYLDLDEAAFLDHIESITDTSNTKIKLEQKTWAWYRRNVPDPSQTTGDPMYYIRRNNRVYFTPRTTSDRNFVIDFRKLTEDLKLLGDMTLLPNQYDFWIISEALVIWYTMEDPTSVPALVIEERNEKRAAAVGSIKVSYDQIRQAGSNCEQEYGEMSMYKRPIPSP